MIVNGIEVQSLEQLEDLIKDMGEENKVHLRSIYNNVPSQPITKVMSVTPRQIRIALIQSGISLTAIESMIDSLPEPQKSVAKITWEYSVEFQRNNSLLVQMAPLLGLTETDVDNLFALAITL